MRKFLMGFILGLSLLMAALVTVSTDSKKYFNDANFQGLDVYGVSNLFMYDNDNSNSMLIKSANNLADDNTVFMYPATNGSANQCLVTNGSGITSWGSVDRQYVNGGTINNVAIYDGSGVLSQEAQLAPSRGGTGQNVTGATTGIPEVNAGVWSFAAGIDDLADVDITTNPPEEGQALVWDSGASDFVPGASGDSSFKVQSFTTTTLTIKFGRIIINGKEYCTYDGLGSQEADTQTDLVYTPAGLGATQKYYLYIDTDGAVEVTLTADSNRVCQMIENDDFHFSTSDPNSISDASRYIPIGLFSTNGSSQIDAIYNYAFRYQDTWKNIELTEPKILARYSDDAQDTFGSVADVWDVIDFEAQRYDVGDGSPNVTTGGSWVFTAPRNSYYLIESKIHFNSWIALAAGKYIEFGALVGGIAYGLDQQGEQTVNAMQGHVVVYMAKGDTAAIRARTNHGSIVLSTSDDYSWVSISEVNDYKTSAAAAPNVTFSTRITSKNTSGTGSKHLESGLPSGLTGRTDYQCTCTFHDDSAGRDSDYTAEGFSGSCVYDKAVSGQVTLDLDGITFAASDYVDVVCDLGAKASALPLVGEQAVTATGSVASGHYNFIVYGDTTSGAITTTLHSAAGLKGQEVTLKKTSSDTNIWTIDGAGAETIDGKTTVAFSSQNDWVRVRSDGTNWQAIAWKIADLYDTNNTVGSTSNGTPYELATLTLPKGLYRIHFSGQGNGNTDLTDATSCRNSMDMAVSTVSASLGSTIVSDAFMGPPMVQNDSTKSFSGYGSKQVVFDQTASSDVIYLNGAQNFGNCGNISGSAMSRYNLIATRIGL
jgi:hypothetical protein